MKKITFFICNMYNVGGTEKVVSIIANELSKKYKVEIVSLYKTKEKPSFDLNSNIPVLNILENELNPFKIYFPYLKYKVKNFFKRYDTDVFITVEMKYVPLTIFMKNKAKYISWEHFNSFSAVKGSMTWYGRKLSAKYADKIVVLTKKDMENNIKLFGTQSKIVQIYNPIQLFENKNEYNVNSKKILSSGRLSDQKGFDMLIDVAANVFKVHPDWEWHIFGEGTEREKLTQMIKERNLEDKVKLMGKTDRMIEIYNDYSMFVMTSRYEGFAMVNIEAHNAKLPIVSFDCNCGPDEIIKDEVNGYLVECFDIDKMSDRISSLINNSNLRQKMSNNTNFDKDKLKIENIIANWESII